MRQLLRKAIESVTRPKAIGFPLHVLNGDKLTDEKGETVHTFTTSRTFRTRWELVRYLGSIGLTDGMKHTYE